MQITLKQARRLEKDIEQAISIAYKSSVSHGSFNVSIHELINAKIEALRQESAQSQADGTELITARYAVRGLIAAAKETSGLNKLITQEAMIKDMMTRANIVAAQPPLVDQELTIAVARLDALRASKPAVNDAYGRSSDTISVTGYLTEQVVTAATEQVRASKKQLVAIADKCAAMNSTVLVELDDGLVKTLTKFKLI